MSVLKGTKICNKIVDLKEVGTEIIILKSALSGNGVQSADLDIFHLQFIFETKISMGTFCALAKTHIS